MRATESENGSLWTEDRRLFHVLSQQLPSYLDSDDCQLGWFVAIRYRDGGATMDWETKAPNIAAAVAREQRCRLYAASIDGRPKASSSKLEPRR